MVRRKVKQKRGMGSAGRFFNSKLSGQGRPQEEGDVPTLERRDRTMWVESIPGRESSMCKGPVMGMCLKNGKETRVGIVTHGKY